MKSNIYQKTYILLDLAAGWLLNKPYVLQNCQNSINNQN